MEYLPEQVSHQALSLNTLVDGSKQQPRRLDIGELPQMNDNAHAFLPEEYAESGRSLFRKAGNAAKSMGQQLHRRQKQ